MQNLYFDQPILSNCEVADVLRRTGLDFATWPQSVLPDEMLKALDTGTDEDMTMLTAHDASDASEEYTARLNEYRAEHIAENHAPRAVLRTSWGLLIGEKTAADIVPDKPFTRYSVQVQCEKGWNNKNLGAYCDRCMELLDESLQDFLKRNREVDIEMADATVDGILELSVYISAKDDESAEEIAAEGLANYLAQIVEDGTLDRVVKVGCSDEVARHYTAG